MCIRDSCNTAPELARVRVSRRCGPTPGLHGVAGAPRPRAGVRPPASELRRKRPEASILRELRNNGLARCAPAGARNRACAPRRRSLALRA
eukprot:7187167-Alexandrium_andersonii.AAC.1